MLEGASASLLSGRFYVPSTRRSTKLREPGEFLQGAGWLRQTVTAKDATRQPLIAPRRPPVRARLAPLTEVVEIGPVEPGEAQLSATEDGG